MKPFLLLALVPLIWSPVLVEAKPPAANAPSVSIADATCSESVGSCVLTITKGRGKSYSQVSIRTVDGTAHAGADYTATNMTLTLGNGTTSQQVSIPIIDDAATETNEKFTVVLSAVRNATIARSPATVTITDNDGGTGPAPTFAIQDATTGETQGAVDVHIVKTGSNGQSSTITYTTADGTATAGSDYATTSGSLTFADNETDKTVTIMVRDDDAVESAETLKLNISASANATISRSSATITINDNDVAPAPTPDPDDPLLGETTIDDDFAYADGVSPTTYGPNGTPGIPAQSADDVGAFRMKCGAGAVLKDDPIVYPGQAGASHAHQFVGNDGIDANSTYTSLRTTGGTTCGDPDTPFNRSGYWIPAMLDGHGKVVKVDFLNLYYKRLPATAPGCTDPVRKRGICIDLPNGLRYIFGFNMTTGTNSQADPNTWEYWFFGFECWGSEDGQVGNGTATGRYHSIPEVAAAGCPVGAQLVIIGFAEDCWDGVHVDTADHRSHMSYAIGEDKGYGRVCDAAHPYLIPDLQFQWHYTVDANLADWSLSSDAMYPGHPAGYTMHMDYWEAWSKPGKDAWEKNCINGHLTCSDGDLGNGTFITGAGAPVGGFPTHVLVDVP